MAMTTWTIIGLLALCHSCIAYTKFPEGFTFGVATASHQIEGAWNVSGKSENVWDRLTHSRPEMIADGTNGDIACESYYRYQEDVEELVNLGVDFYRFSLSWARILPTGRIDYVNPDGIRYYNELLDALAENNIEPLVTLFHWDLPQSLQDLGGWTNPKMIDYFRDYADLCFKEFGTKIKSWITLNEPYEICEDAYGDEKKAPALDSHGVGNYLCSDNVLKAHAETYHLYNETYRPVQNGRIMISINSIWYEPSNPSNAEQVALAEVANQFKFGWFAHPIFTVDGGYPPVMVDNVARQSAAEGLSKPRLEQFDDYWIQRIKGTSDFMGINYYTTHLITGPGVDPKAKSPSWLKDIGAVTTMEVGGDSASEWLRVVPTGFANMLRWCKSSYNDPPIYITENGFSDLGTLVDYGRINYFNDHLSEILNVIYDDGVKVLGYTAWTLMDNFEWRAGFSERFGFYYVNISDPERPRTPKLSASYYRELVANRELPQNPRYKDPALRSATRLGRVRVLAREFGGDVRSLWRYGAPFPTFLKLIGTLILCLLVLLPLIYPVFIVAITYFTYESLFLSWWLDQPWRFLPGAIARRAMSAAFRPASAPDVWKVREVLTRAILLTHSLATSVDYLCVMQGLLDET